jgi:hypothetical protein
VWQRQPSALLANRARSGTTRVTREAVASRGAGRVERALREGLVHGSRIKRRVVCVPERALATTYWGLTTVSCSYEFSRWPLQHGTSKNGPFRNGSVFRCFGECFDCDGARAAIRSRAHVLSKHRHVTVFRTVFSISRGMSTSLPEYLRRVSPPGSHLAVPHMPSSPHCTNRNAHRNTGTYLTYRIVPL